MKLLRLTICDFMVYKDYKIGLKFIFPVCRINLRIQDITCPLINHFITIHHDIFFEVLSMRIFSLYLPSAFETCCFRSSSKHAIQAGVSEPKNNICVPCDGIFHFFFKLFPCFYAISTGYIQFFFKF